MVCEAWIVNKILAGPTSYFMEALKLALVGLAVALLDQISFLAAINIHLPGFIFSESLRYLCISI